jgi:hypothetical protein
MEGMSSSFSARIPFRSSFEHHDRREPRLQSPILDQWTGTPIVRELEVCLEYVFFPW